MNALPSLASPAFQLLTARLGLVLLQFLWQGAAIAIVFAAVRWLLLSKAAPASRYALSCAALALTAVAPVVTWYRMADAPMPPAAATQFPPSPGAVFSAGSPLQLLIEPQHASLPSLLSALACLWLLGVVLLSLRLLRDWAHAARLCRQSVSPLDADWLSRFSRLRARAGVSARIRILVSARIDTPAVIGWLRPLILVPASLFTGFAPHEIESLLLHELCHIRRHDYVVQLVQRLVEIAFFYHPAVWWLSAQVREERECSCDAFAVAHGGGSAVAFARLLVALEGNRAGHGTALAATGGPLTRRVVRLVSGQIPRRNYTGAPYLAVTGLAAVAVLLSAAALIAQLAQPRLHFEVVSIKPLPPGTHMQRAIPGPISPGSYHDPLTPLARLIAFAYPDTAVPGVTLFGLPAWGNRDQLFDFAARSNAADAPSRDQMRLMMRAALENRFQFKFHIENRELPVYFLVLGKGGPRNMVLAGAAEPYALSGSIGENEFVITARAASTHELASHLLELVLQRPVIDRTGLPGYYDVKYQFLPVAPVQAPPAPGDPPRLLMQALREKLGLELVPGKTAVPVMVVDHAQKPTPN